MANSHPGPQGPARLAMFGAACVAALALASNAAAAPAADDGLSAITARLDAQARLLAEQEKRLADQAELIDQQRLQIKGMRAEQDRVLDSIRAAGVAAPAGAGVQLAQTEPGARAADIPTDPGGSLPIHPVGEGPGPAAPEVVAALPQAVSVLTAKGHWVIDTSLEYDRSSSNRLVFRGIEIVPGVNLGLVDANGADRDVAVGAVDFRYGLTRRLEIEARIPYTYRHDRLTVLAQQVSSSIPAVNQTQDLSGNAVGDVEIAARYQLNDPPAGRPFFIAGLRVKSRTGLGPYDVSFDADGISKNLATGSGFWGIEPSLTMLLPSDPVVIFGTIGYLDSLNRNINRDLVMSTGTPTHIGEARPGGSVNASLGFAFSLNDRFSFSLGYSHSFILPTTVQLNGADQRSNALQVGAMTLGWSYRLKSNLTLNNSFEFGVTSDAPNLRIVTRLPFSL